jgi:hypothetical protein
MVVLCALSKTATVVQPTVLVSQTEQCGKAHKTTIAYVLIAGMLVAQQAFRRVAQQALTTTNQQPSNQQPTANNQPPTTNQQPTNQSEQRLA